MSDVTIVTPLTVSLVAAVSFFNAAYNAAVGPTGGAMITGFAASLPPQLALLLHAIGNIIGATTRSLTYRRYLRLYPSLVLLGGIALGLGTGAYLFQFVPEVALQLAIGTAMLLLTWLPKPEAKGAPSLWRLGLASFFAAAVNLYVATAVLMAAYCERYFDGQAEGRKLMLAHVNLWSLIQNGLKIVFFTTFMVIDQHATLVLTGVVLGSMMVGHFVGLAVADRVSERILKFLLKALITFSALALLYKAAETLMA